MASQRTQILQAYAALVAAITVANGFQSDAGALVFLGEARALGRDDPDQAIAIVPGDEDPRWQEPGKAFDIKLPIEVHGLVKSADDASWLSVEALVADIKRAVEVGDGRLGGLLQWPMARGPVMTLSRQAGSLNAGAAVLYLVQFKEGWGHP